MLEMSFLETLRTHQVPSLNKNECMEGVILSRRGYVHVVKFMRELCPCYKKTSGGGRVMSTLQYTCTWEDYVHLYNVGQARFFSEAILSYTLPSENK